MSIDKNFNVIVSSGYDRTETNIVLSQGFGYLLPDPLFSDSFNLLWWNLSDYINPSNDPNVEIVRCIARYEDTLVVMRSQEGTLNSDKNIPDKTYSMLLIPDIKDLSFYNIPQIHGKTKHDTTTVDGGAALGVATQIPAHGSAQHTGTIGATSQVTEDTNLYFTNIRAQSAISNTSPITYGSGVIGISQAGSGSNGYLSSTDWNTFNGKQSALGYTPVNKIGDTMSGNLTVNAQYASAKYAGSISVNWNNGNVQSMALANGANSFSLINGISGGRYLLLLTSGGASTTATWPASVKWSGGTAPTLTTTAGKVDIITFVYDGTSYYGASSLNY